MSTTSPHDLGALVAAPAVQLLAAGAEHGARSWVVRLGQDLYVRTVPGDRWSPAGRARVRLDGAEYPVVLTEVAPELHGPLDDAYRAKYDPYGPAKVDAVLSDPATASTFRLRPQRASVRERVAGTVAALRRRAAASPAASPADVPCTSG
ncbi:DUF2255 family protein [Isoptericola cucumis]|uniref:ASCH domain-containing protein n=1 Tax=Isoptericola cucumis TaxID=1776856 RepID=A0ABQ2BBY1_9MICO|nr:DUF2255 family protein [Isoptericola cucumis]GGI10749.1 hypothetical protein GCM10007368_32780 [Isoptericola cucumis]